MAVAGSAPGATTVGTGSRSPVPTGEREPERASQPPSGLRSALGSAGLAAPVPGPNDVDAAFMSWQQHESVIHIV
jgi:hypothetical protein